ncbi:hypothetical protein DFP73DRAFT_554201 [Morchella snyderi]|nr:hypothetical protein DFP73DRAFT_554201 [Morchella snyderi]
MNLPTITASMSPTFYFVHAATRTPDQRYALQTLRIQERYNNAEAIAIITSIISAVIAFLTLMFMVYKNRRKSKRDSLPAVGGDRRPCSHPPTDITCIYMYFILIYMYLASASSRNLRNLRRTPNPPRLGFDIRRRSSLRDPERVHP